MNTAVVRALLVMVLLGLAALAAPSSAWAGGVVTTCDEAHFDTALTGGGLVTFTCGPATITVTSMKTIAASTTIDGTGGIAISGGGTVPVFKNNFGSTFTVQNLTIQNGKGSVIGRAGGISSDGTTIVTNCTFTGNTGDQGGAIESDQPLTVTNSTFTGNSATVDGGAIYSLDVMTITNSTFTGNSVVAPGDLGGGAIANFFTGNITGSTISGNSIALGLNGGGIYNDGTLTIATSVISGNTVAAGGGGGGIYNNSTMTITASAISGNSAGPAGGNGGGVYNNGTLSMTDSTISGNTAAGGGKGAGLYENSNGNSYSRNTFNGNTTNGNGGGIYVNGQPLTLTNVTISGNTAASGGGIYNNGNGLHIVAATIASNTGGGIANNGSADATGTIIANNGVNCSLASISDAGTNLQFPGNSCSAASIPSADPLLQPLANNGGPTQTMALIAGSPAIDTNTEICPSTPPTDQRGIARPQGPHCDIGAFELVAGGGVLVGTPVNFTAVQGLSFSGAVATFTSTNPANVAADFTVTINWGDTTTTTATITGSPSGFTVTGTHTYATAGPFTATVTINDTNPVATVTVVDSVTVVPVLAGTPVNFTAVQGLSFTRTVATFTSANPANTLVDLSATINWGDGTTTPGTITGGAGSFTVTGTHAYATVGPFTATVTINDASPVTSVTVTDSVTVVPVLAGAPVNFTEAPGVPFTGAVATFTDANPANTLVDLSATINWGDGTTTPGTITGGAGSFTVIGTHTYATAGPFTATVSITDDSPVVTVTETDSVNSLSAASAQVIPTMTAWALAALAMLLGALGLCFFPRRIREPH